MTGIGNYRWLRPPYPFGDQQVERHLRVRGGRDQHLAPDVITPIHLFDHLRGGVNGRGIEKTEHGSQGWAAGRLPRLCRVPIGGGEVIPCGTTSQGFHFVRRLQGGALLAA